MIMRLPQTLLFPIAAALIYSAQIHAEEASITLNERQIQALGIQIQPSGMENLGNTLLPAQVTVPNSQMRAVTAPVGGVIESLLVAPGDRVKRGQTLGRIVSREVLELQREAVQSTTQAKLLKQNLERDELLFSEGLITESRLQATRAAATQATAQAEQQQQSLKLAGARNGKQMTPVLSVKAPIDGVVLELLAQTGQRLDPATALYRIASLSPLWLEIQAPYALASRLRLGQSLRTIEPALTARLIAVGRQIDSASQSVLLRAEINTGAEQLTPGQMLSVELPEDKAGTGTSQQRLPATAIVRDGQQSFVFVMTGKNPKSGEMRFKAQNIRVLAQGGQSATVDGLQAGEMLVVRGASGLKSMLGSSKGK